MKPLHFLLPLTQIKLSPVTLQKEGQTSAFERQKYFLNENVSEKLA